MEIGFAARWAVPAENQERLPGGEHLAPGNRKGIMTDAVKQICNYVFKYSDILRINAEPFAYNTGSCRVLEKAGFQYEGTLRKNAVKNGKVIDMKMYSLLR